MADRILPACAAAVLGLALSTGPAPARAVDYEMCAIILCALAGFPAEPTCVQAGAKMARRVFRGKSPIPPLSDCWVDEHGNADPAGADGWEIVQGPAAKIPGRNGRPDRYRLGTECVRRDRNEGMDPPGCTGTYMAVQLNGPDGPGELGFFPMPRKPTNRPGTGVGGCRLNFDDDCDPR